MAHIKVIAMGAKDHRIMGFALQRPFVYHYLLASRSLTSPGGTSGGRGCSRSGRPQAGLPFLPCASARHMQS